MYIYNNINDPIKKLVIVLYNTLYYFIIRGNNGAQQQI